MQRGGVRPHLGVRVTVCTPEVVMRYRFHTTNTTRQREQIGPNLVRILKQSIDRQRAADA